MQGAMANMFYHPGKHNIIILYYWGLDLLSLIYTVAVILYYITICLYITGSMASMLVAIIKTLVVIVW